MKMAAASGARLLNPPLMGILAGVFIGATPLAAYVLPGSTPPPLSLELSLFAAVGRCAMDAVALLGAAALPIQVRSVSQLGRAKRTPTCDEWRGVGADDCACRFHCAQDQRHRATPAAALRARPCRVCRLATLYMYLTSEAAWFKHLTPPGRLGCGGARRLSVLLGVSVVRLVVLPALTLGLVLWLRSLGLLPADPLVALVLLVQAAMPSAQNLVLLMQLQPATRYMAPKMAGMLLRQYALATLSVTAWTSVFVALLL